MKKYIKSARMFELSPVDNRKSFYGKAKVLDNGNGEYILYSYDTPVARVKDGVYEDLEYDHHSQTTNRHVRAFKKYFDIESACGKGRKVTAASEVPDIAYECADIIADEIRRRGVMGFEEVDERIHEISGMDYEDIFNTDLNVDVYGILNYRGIGQNFSTGDFYTDEYAEKHPEVAEE